MGAWIEMDTAAAGMGKAGVAPFMGAWIEIAQCPAPALIVLRRTLHGCVD